jgi:hypothetical protein
MKSPLWAKEVTGTFRWMFSCLCRDSNQYSPVVHPVVYSLYEGVSKIFGTDAVKINKFIIRPIGRHHPRSSSLPHVDTGPTVSSIFGKLPGSPFLSMSTTPRDSAWIPQNYQTGVLSTSISVLERGRSHRVPNQESKVGGRWQPFLFRQKLLGEDGSIRGALSRWSSQVCSRQSSGRRLRTFPRSRHKTSQWNPEFTVLPIGTGASHYHNCCTRTDVAATIRNILDTTSYISMSLHSS